MKVESEIESNVIFTKASVTLGVERTTETTRNITDTMTIPPGKSVAVYQEQREYDVWSGVKANIIGTLGDNCRETVFLEGGVNDDFPDIKYL